MWNRKFAFGAVVDNSLSNTTALPHTGVDGRSYVAKNTGLMFTLSPQQLVSCAPNPDHCGGTGGCLGSIAELAFDYVKENGFTTEWKIPC